MSPSRDLCTLGDCVLFGTVLREEMNEGFHWVFFFLSQRTYFNAYIYSIYCGIWFWNCLCFMRWHAWHFSFSLSLTSLYSCWKGGICTLWYWEHKLVDCRRRGDSPPRGHHHYFHPILETVSHRQAGVPARRHDLYSAETEGRLKSLFYFSFFFFFALHLVKVNGQEVELLFLWGHNVDEIIAQFWELFKDACWHSFTCQGYLFYFKLFSPHITILGQVFLFTYIMKKNQGIKEYYMTKPWGKTEKLSELSVLDNWHKLYLSNTVWWGKMHLLCRFKLVNVCVS